MRLKFYIILAIALAAVFGCANFISAQCFVCTPHAYRLCNGNDVFWFDSCGSQQDFFQSCTGFNMACRYGQCVYLPPLPPPPPPNPYVAHSKTACYGNNVYWYDSLGAVNDIYKNCADQNSCTADTCASAKCANTLKCDGSTCAENSSDYNTYCATNNPQPQPSANFSISFFVKQDPNASQWQKTVQVNANGQAYFMISLANSGTSQIDNVSVSANIPNEIASLGNVKIDNVPLSGDIVSGINIGSLPPMSAKTITFEGRTKDISTEAAKQATATANIAGAPHSDSVTVDLVPGQGAPAAVSSSGALPAIWAFIKRWYLWIFVGAVLIFLFIVVYRRLSTSNG